MRILVLQTGRFEHFLAATRAVAARYARPDLVGLVRESAHETAKQTVNLVEVGIWPSNPSGLASLPIWKTPIDLCVVPFEDRFGVCYWRFRRLPIRQGIPKVASFDGRGCLREWNRTTWLLNSLLACGGIRAAYALYTIAGRCWSHARRWLDIAGLFSLAGIALVLRFLKTLGLHPFALVLQGRLPTDRRRTALFIPSLGMGGAQRQLITYLEHIDRNQWDVEVVTLNALDKFFEPVVGLMHVSVTQLDPNPKFWKVGVVWQLMEHLRAKPCHVLHSWLHFAVFSGAIAGNLVGIPTVIGSLRSERPGRFPWFFPRWQRCIDILTAPLSDLLIANSNAVREENRRWAYIPERKIVTVYNGIKTEEIQAPTNDAHEKLRSDLRLPSDASLIGIVGRLSPEKDHATFLRAAALIHRAHPKVHFLIVGDGPCRQHIESEIKTLGLFELIHMLGERKDTQQLIKLLNVLVLTSTSEGLPNVLLEAGVSGIPVVTTAAGGASEVVMDGETGFVVPCGNQEAIADRVLELLADSGLRKRFKEAAQDRMRKVFAADRTALAIQACYAKGK